jgi:hypothetical protein
MHTKSQASCIHMTCIAAKLTKVYVVDGQRVIYGHLGISKGFPPTLIVIEVCWDTTRCGGLSKKMIRIARRRDRSKVPACG